MAGAMRKMAVYLGLVEEDPHDREYDGQYDDEEYEEPVVRPVARDRHRDEPATRSMTAVRPEPPVASPAAPRSVRQGTRPVDSTRITTLHPRTYNEARTIGEHFRDGTPVIMNLTDMDDSDAKRLVDFAAGLVFALRGTIERITNKVFLLSPANVSVTAEDKARIAEGSFFNQS
ncbi:MAG: cell division protein SepF [Actinomycetes bacterium]